MRAKREPKAHPGLTALDRKAIAEADAIRKLRNLTFDDRKPPRRSRVIAAQSQIPRRGPYAGIGAPDRLSVAGSGCWVGMRTA
jgi:hypothetical protein